MLIQMMSPFIPCHHIKNWNSRFKRSCILFPSTVILPNKSSHTSKEPLTAAFGSLKGVPQYPVPSPFPPTMEPIQMPTGAPKTPAIQPTEKTLSPSHIYIYTREKGNVSHSSCESKIYATDKGTKSVLTIRHLLQDLGFSDGTIPTPV
jgi:hypothetical protein